MLENDIKQDADLFFCPGRLETEAEIPFLNIINAFPVVFFNAEERKDSSRFLNVVFEFRPWLNDNVNVGAQPLGLFQ